MLAIALAAVVMPAAECVGLSAKRAARKSSSATAAASLASAGCARESAACACEADSADRCFVFHGARLPWRLPLALAYEGVQLGPKARAESAAEGAL